MNTRIDRSRGLSLIFVGIAALFFASIAIAQSRIPVDPSGPFPKLAGQLRQMPDSRAFGNAFVIGRKGCHILTNFHVAFGISKDPRTGFTELIDNPDIGHAVYFSFDLDEHTGTFQRTIKAKVVDFGDYEIGTAPGTLGDIALLRLETCLGSEYGGLEIDRPPPHKRVPTGELMTISSSRNASGKNETLFETGCRSLPGTSITGLMLTNCEAVPGMSGSMILELGEDQKWRLIGMNVSGTPEKNGRRLGLSMYVSAINKFLDGITDPDFQR